MGTTNVFSFSNGEWKNGAVAKRLEGSRKGKAGKMYVIQQKHRKRYVRQGS